MVKKKKPMYDLVSTKTGLTRGTFTTKKGAMKRKAFLLRRRADVRKMRGQKSTGKRQFKIVKIKRR